jgi:two-component system NarL family sensor kinase
MIKHLCMFYAYLLITCFKVVAQPEQNVYARFIEQTKNLKEDTNKVLTYVKFLKLHEALSQDTDLYIIEQAKKLSVKLNYQRGIELSTLHKGIYEEQGHRIDLALRDYNEAAKMAEGGKFYSDIYQIYNLSLNIYYYTADYINAMDIAQKGLALAEQFNDKEDIAHYNNQVAFIYQKQEKADISIKYYTQYLTLANEIHNQMMVADAYNGIADDYLLKKNYKTSLLYSFKALDIYNNMRDGQRIDGTRIVFKSGRIAATLLKISTIYKQARNYKQALHYSLMFFDLYHKNREHFNKYDVASYYINAGEIYSALKEYKRAGILLDNGLSLSRYILHREDIRDAYEGLSTNFAFQKRFDSAYYYHILFTQLKDSIINEKVSREINTLDLERKDKEIALLNQQKKLKDTENARENLERNFFIGFIALIAVIAFLLLYIQNDLKVNKLVSEKHMALQTERQRISSDMHDDIGTGLSTMLIYVNMLKLKKADGDDNRNIDRIAALGIELVEQMKEIVWSLSPGNDRLDSLLLFIRQYFALLLNHWLMILILFSRQSFRMLS